MVATNIGLASFAEINRFPPSKGRFWFLLLLPLESSRGLVRCTGIQQFGPFELTQVNCINLDEI